MPHPILNIIYFYFYFWFSVLSLSLLKRLNIIHILVRYRYVYIVRNIFKHKHEETMLYWHTQLKYICHNHLSIYIYFFWFTSWEERFLSRTPLLHADTFVFCDSLAAASKNALSFFSALSLFLCFWKKKNKNKIQKKKGFIY